MSIKSLVYIETLIRNQWYKLKGLLLKVYLIAHGCEVGKGLKCKRWPIFRCPPNRNIFFGDNVTIGYYITLEAGSAGKIITGDHVNLTHNIIISSNEEIRIGDFTLIGENVSLRDTDHKTDLNAKIAIQTVLSDQIIIGKDVWIGAGSIILKGSKLGEGSVIAANSVVTQHNVIEDYHVYAGSPVKRVGKR